jgi:small subunit ribosomal protein S7
MRGKKPKIRMMGPDAKYQSAVATRFINKIMLHGKKTIAEKLFQAVVDGAATELNVDPIEFINKVVDTVAPSLEVKSRRVGGANYSVPIPVSLRRKEALAVRWLVDAARAKSGASFDILLKKEMIDAYNGIGSAMEKRNNVEKMAEANKAFAHFSW